MTDANSSLILKLLRKENIKGLCKIFVDGDVATRNEVTEAISSIKMKKVLPPIYKIFRDEDWKLRKSAAEIITILKFPVNKSQVPWFYMANLEWEKCVLVGPVGVKPIVHAIYVSDWDIRQTAAKYLKKFESNSINKLFPYIFFSDNMVRYSIAETLGIIGNKRAITLLIKALAIPDNTLQSIIIESLGNIKDIRVVKPIIKSLKNRDPVVRRYSAIALGKLLGENAERILIPFLRDKDTYVKRDIIDILGNYGGANSGKPLIKLLYNSSESVRTSARDALRNIGGAIVEDLIESITDKKVRPTSILILGLIGDQRATDAIITEINKNNSDSLEISVCALGKIGGEKAKNRLIAGLKDQKIRQFAAEALGAVGEASTAPILIDVLKDGNLSVRKRAAIALGNIGDERATTSLINGLIGEQEKEIGFYADALKNIGHTALYPILKALDDPNINTDKVISLAGVLGTIHSPKSVEALIDILNYKKFNTSFINFNVVIRALENIGGIRAVEGLIYFIQNKREGTYFYVDTALLAIGRIGDSRAVEPLIKYLDRKVNIERTIYALGELGDERAVKPLIKIFNESGNRAEKIQIKSSLSKIGGEVAIKALPYLKFRFDDYIKEYTGHPKEY